MDKVGLSSSYCLNLCGHHDHRSVRETWIVKLLDSCKFRELTWLITELNANLVTSRSASKYSAGQAGWRRTPPTSLISSGKSSELMEVRKVLALCWKY